MNAPLLKSDLLKYLFILCVCVGTSICVHALHVCRSQKRVWDISELELQVVESQLIWKQGRKPRPLLEQQVLVAAEPYFHPLK